MKRSIVDAENGKVRMGVVDAKKSKVSHHQDHSTSSLLSCIQSAKHSIESIGQELLSLQERSQQQRQQQSMVISLEESEQFQRLMHQVDLLRAQFSSLQNEPTMVPIPSSTSVSRSREDSSADRTSIALLTDDLIAAIYDFLFAEDVIRGLLVNKQWYSTLCGNSSSSCIIDGIGGGNGKSCSALKTLAFSNDEKQSKFLHVATGVEVTRPNWQHVRYWTMDQIMQYMDRMIRNECVLESISMPSEVSSTELIAICERINQRIQSSSSLSSSDRSHHKVSRSARIIQNNVRHLVISLQSRKGSIHDKTLFQAMAKQLPQLTHLEVRNKSYKIRLIHIIQSLCQLQSLTVRSGSFILPRKLRKEYGRPEDDILYEPRDDDDNGNDDDANVSNDEDDDDAENDDNDESMQDPNHSSQDDEDQDEENENGDEENDDYDDIDNYDSDHGMDFDDGSASDYDSDNDDCDSFIPHIIHKQCVRAEPQLNRCWQLQKFVVTEETALSTFILALQLFPQLNHIELFCTVLCNEDVPNDCVPYLVNQLNICDTERLRRCSLRMRVHKVHQTTVTKSMIDALSRAESLEHFSFEPMDEWNEDLNQYFIHQILDKLYQRETCCLSSFAFVPSSLSQSALHRICDIVEKHKLTIRSLSLKLTNDQSLSQLSRCTQLSQLKLEKGAVARQDLPYVELLSNLRELQLRCDHLIQLDRFPCLETLRLEGKFTSLTICSPSIQTLDLRQCTVSSVAISCPGMYHLELPPLIYSLKLHSCLMLSNIVLDSELLQCQIVNCSLLSTVDLRYCSSLTELDIAHCCPNIRVLHVPNFNQIRPYGCSRNLQQLHIYGCSVSTNDIINILTNGPPSMTSIQFTKAQFNCYHETDMSYGGKVNPFIQELILHKLGEKSRVPFQLLSVLTPNLTRFHITCPNGDDAFSFFQRNSETELLGGINAWSKLKHLKFKDYSFQNLSTVSQSLTLNHLESLVLINEKCYHPEEDDEEEELEEKGDESYPKLKLPSCIAQTIQSLEANVETEFQHMQFPCLTALFLDYSSNSFPGYKDFDISVDSFSQFPCLQDVNLRVASLAWKDVRKIVRMLVQGLPRLKRVSFAFEYAPWKGYFSYQHALQEQYPKVAISFAQA